MQAVAESNAKTNSIRSSHRASNQIVYVAGLGIGDSEQHLL